METLSASELQRYSRHLLLPEFGRKSQQRLKSARVVVVGAGGLGSPSLLYLAAAGVGTIGIVDFDQVELSNLQRQVLHGTSAIGTSKVDSALARLRELNPKIRFNAYREALSARNVMEIFREYDVVLDGTDSYATRYLINDACVLLGKPNISATVFRFEGQLSIFGAPGGPCYRCLYPEPPVPGTVPSCGEGGVLGVVPGVLGTLQASECVKYVAGVGETLVGRLFTIDLLTMRTRMLKFPRDRACAVCGETPTIDRLTDSAESCAAITEPATEPVTEIEPELLRAWMTESPSRHDFVLVDVRTPDERLINAITPSLSVPLAMLEKRSGELPRDREIILYCKGGVRSASAAGVLKSLGFAKLRSLKGGILRWIERVEPDLPTY